MDRNGVFGRRLLSRFGTSLPHPVKYHKADIDSSNLDLSTRPTSQSYVESCY